MKNSFTLKSFIEELIKVYGYAINKSYRQIADEIGRVSHTTIRDYFIRLEKLGCLEIENKGSCRQSFILNKAKVKQING